MRAMIFGLSVLVGCDPGSLTTDTGDGQTNPGTNDIYAIGDSIMAWNGEEGSAIPDIVGQERGQRAINASIGGTMITDFPQEPERSILNQYTDGDWSWLVMDGGGNDLNDLCGCGDCDAVMDSMISADGSRGRLPGFVGPLASSGIRVAFMGYPELPDGAAFGFNRCDDVFAELDARIERMAAFDERIIFVDMAEVITASDLEMFVDDRVHPSAQGSAVMGRHLAQAMDAAEP
ncbi:MAG: SGNH/GDSL hydrolase family protein [Myxococcota bacterium]